MNYKLFVVTLKRKAIIINKRVWLIRNQKEIPDCYNKSISHQDELDRKDTESWKF